MKLLCTRALAVLFLASPSEAAPALTDYLGAYPFQEVGGYAFFENPIVRQAIDRYAGEGISDWLADLSVGLPIEREADGLIAIACEEHNCSGKNAAVAVSVAGDLIVACLYSDGGDHGAPPGRVRWIGPQLEKVIE